MSRIHIDCFSSLDDIPKRERGDPNTLLAFFKSSGVRRVSTFEMDDKIMSALKQLEKRGDIRFLSAKESPYPWHGFVMMEKKP